MIETIKEFIQNTIEYADQCSEEHGEKSIEYITAQYAVDILLQLAEDLEIEIQKGKVRGYEKT